MLAALAACTPPPSTPAYVAPTEPVVPAAAPAAYDLRSAGTAVDRISDYVFNGGRVDLEMRRDGNRVIEVAYNRFAVPVVLQWEEQELINVDPIEASSGVAVLPAADRPNGEGPGVVLTTLAIGDTTQAYHRMIQLHARFGSPDARPVDYAYRLPYHAGKTFSVLQGFHGQFSHRGSNEFAVDFDCPVATPVLAARPGIVVATNAAAQGAGTTPDYLEYKRTNFVLVLHDDGTLGEYMHLAPSSIEVARNHFAVPIVLEWHLTDLDNLEPLAPPSGVAILPAAAQPDGNGAPVVLATLQIVDRSAPYHRAVLVHERFGDPAARPHDYAYRLPYRTGKTFSVLQGFHGAFSHRGSNEYAIDFDCPVATHVLAARPGVVVAANAAAQGSGTTPEFLEYRRTNFVLVLHDDGTLGEYMHLAPSGVLVRAGQRVARGDERALSGNTGFSSTPHLHFQVMTAGDDGRSARSFPFRIAVGPNVVEDPVQGRSYRAWE